jgi:hypothetical protein
LTLVGNSQTVFCGQLTEPFMGTHDYRMRMIIKPLVTVSTEIFSVIWDQRRRKSARRVPHFALARVSIR